MYVVVVVVVVVVVLVVHSCLNNDFLWNSCLATLPGN
jgi:hypothetical protein